MTANSQEDLVDTNSITAGSDGEIRALSTLGQYLINSILERKPAGEIKTIINSGAPLWFQTESDGMSTLHAAAYIRDLDLVNLLIEKGAIWNAVDHLAHTAGDIALSFNDAGIYTAIRDAGIRTELLLTLLSDKSSLDAPSSIVLRATDSTATGSTDTFLSSKLRFVKDDHGQEICLLQTEAGEVGVMMGWENEIMKKTVECLCTDHENSGQLKILNVGFGLGIIDNLFQSLSVRPIKHIIIEPHPDVLQHMRALGWYDKPGVQILEGKWQDFVNGDEIHAIGGFDVVYTDTFSEDYSELRRFFEHLPNLLSGPEARFGFFNGLGATNPLFYDVYTHISELHLLEIGVDVKWSDVDVTLDEGGRWGESRKYFNLPLYRMPVGTMASIP